jgi:hypothetical protein
MALNRDPPDLCLLSSQNYRHEPLRLAKFRVLFVCLLMTVPEIEPRDLYMLSKCFTS